MLTITIKSIKGCVLFEGEYTTFKHALEDAVLQKINLSYADLRCQNLSHAELDGAFLHYADFSSSNLIGSNISESVLSYGNFSNACLVGTCFAESHLDLCNFSGALFGGTDITQCHMDGASFDTLSAFDLDFYSVHSMNKCVFQNAQDTRYLFSKPPTVIKGTTPCPLIHLGDTILHGHDVYKADSWIPFMRLHNVKNAA